MLGGSACGQIINGQHLSFDEGRVSELFVTMLQAMGIPADSFADSTGTLEGLT